MLFDSHAHLTCDEVYHNLPNILKRALEQKVDGIVNICTDRVTLERGLHLRKERPWIYTAGATTPHDVEKEGEKNFPLFEKAAKEKKLCAVGETGLDYFYKHSNIEIQKTFLKRYLRLALSTELPVIFHCREAFDDLFAITKEEYTKNGKYLPAVLHCFTGTREEAEEVLQRGWLISFSGIVTFKRSEQLRLVAKETPLTQMLIETDTPYLAPRTRRGKSNEPAFIKETAEVIANVKQIDVEKVCLQTQENAKNIFRVG